MPEAQAIEIDPNLKAPDESPVLPNPFFIERDSSTGSVEMLKHRCH